MERYRNIIEALPYQKPFLFVDKITMLSADEIRGSYTFRKDEYFYQGHFKDQPITPGVILTECMAQIGLVCFFLGNNPELLQHSENTPAIALSETHIIFEQPVLPGDKVEVYSRKIYQRLGKLKNEVQMLKENEEIICRGTISGMILNSEKKY